MKQYKRIKLYGKNPNEIFIKDIKNDYYITNEEEVVNLLNSYVEEIDEMNDHLKFILENITEKNNRLSEENKQLQEKIKKLQEICSRTEEEKEEYVDLYNECRRLKLSDKAIKEVYAELNRREIEKHSLGDTTYTATIPNNSKRY